MTPISILGSTGSVGCSALDAIADAGEAYRVDALAAGSHVEPLIEQARRWRPKFVAIADESQFDALQGALAQEGIACGAGEDALLEASRYGDTVIAAIMGAAGLKPSLAALARGARLAIANKECLVSAGALFREASSASGGDILPVDSEHSAVHQLLDGRPADQIARVALTASGGPFREWPADRMAAITPEDALKHPTWEMGAKITIDSATLMNKGLELIEASVLFDLPDSRLDVVVHPQSIVHALVELADGAVLAHMGEPDMKGPIAYALSYPARHTGVTPRLDLAALGRLTFEAPDETRFACLRLAREALRAGGLSPAALNAANEIAVGAFLERRIRFTDISDTVHHVLDIMANADLAQSMTLDSVLHVDGEARRIARERIERQAA